MRPGRRLEYCRICPQVVFFSTLERYRSGHNGPDSKSGRGLHPHVGSNPTLSANELPDETRNKSNPGPRGSACPQTYTAQARIESVSSSTSSRSEAVAGKRNPR